MWLFNLAYSVTLLLCFVLASTITSFAQNSITFDVSKRPTGVLSASDQEGLWAAYKSAKECFSHPAFGEGRPFTFKKHSLNNFKDNPWASPFTNIKGAPSCSSSAGNLFAPKPIPKVTLNEAYGNRQEDVNQAAVWFRRITNYYRFSRDPLAAEILKSALLDWARNNGLGSGINVSWGNRPVDYQMMTAILAFETAAAELAPIFTPDDRSVIGPWLENLVFKSAASYWKDREDNKAFMRTYMALLWGLIVNDQDIITKSIDQYKIAIHDMRPDGSWPIDSQRGGMGLLYNSAATSHLVMIALIINHNYKIDLFSYSAESRTIHDAVNFVVASLKNPEQINQKYAISCPNGGDLFGSIKKPNLFFVEESAGYLLAYANLFPDRESSKYIKSRFEFETQRDSEKNGGNAACMFATQGSEIELEPLVMPTKVPQLPDPKYLVSIKEELAHEKGRSSSVNSLFMGSVKNGPEKLKTVGFNIKGQFDYDANNFRRLSFVLDTPIEKDKDSVVQKIGSCGGHFAFYEDKKPRLIIDFDIINSPMRPKDIDCITKSLPSKQKSELFFIIDQFQDIAITTVRSREVENFQQEGLKIFFKRIAKGDLQISRQ